jgi:urease accessory protein
MFSSVPVAASCYRSDMLPASASGYRRDTVTLGWEDRLRVRARRVSDQGFEFATALVRGTTLGSGDCFIFDETRIVVHVVEMLEPVFVIAPASWSEAASIAYHIGNSHQPMMVDDDRIVCAELPGMEQVLQYHGIAFTRERRVFTPLGQIPAHLHEARG